MRLWAMPSLLHPEALGVVLPTRHAPTEMTGHGLVFCPYSPSRKGVLCSVQREKQQLLHCIRAYRSGVSTARIRTLGAGFDAG